MDYKDLNLYDIASLITRFTQAKILITVLDGQEVTPVNVDIRNGKVVLGLSAPKACCVESTEVQE